MSVLNIKAKCFVGLDNKFVMTEKFPDTEDYFGVHEMLEEWIGYDDVLSEDDLEVGHYELEFDVQQDMMFNPERDMSDAYLVLTAIKKI